MKGTGDVSCLQWSYTGKKTIHERDQEMGGEDNDIKRIVYLYQLPTVNVITVYGKHALMKIKIF